jgi:uncharacterized protein YndB with AHSA1/START domain
VKQDFLYSVEREYEASMDALWNAWINADALQEWYHPTDLKNVPNSAASVAEVNGLWSIAVDVPQYNMAAYFFGWYTEVAEHQKLVHTMCYTQDPAEFEAKDPNALHHTVVVDFEQRGSKVWVKFSQFGELPEGEAPRAQAGMESYFDSLGEFLAK